MSNELGGASPLWGTAVTEERERHQAYPDRTSNGINWFMLYWTGIQD